MYTLPEFIEEAIVKLIVLDTAQIINDLADRVLETKDSIVDPKEQIAGILLLAVDDAKRHKNPSSSNTLYVAAFNKAQELMRIKL